MTSSLLLELTSVCITTVSSAKTAEPIKTSFAWGVDPWPKEPRIRSGCGKFEGDIPGFALLAPLGELTGLQL